MEYGCIGEKLGHSFSKEIHRALGSYDYELCELTKEELDFIYTRCSRKAARLEEAHLEDIPCYYLSWQVMNKISKVRENQNILKGESV